MEIEINGMKLDFDDPQQMYKEVSDSIRGELIIMQVIDPSQSLGPVIQLMIKKHVEIMCALKKSIEAGD